MIYQTAYHIKEKLEELDEIKQIIIGNIDKEKSLKQLVEEPSICIFYGGETSHKNNYFYSRDLTYQLYIQTRFIGEDEQNFKDRTGTLDLIITKLKEIAGLVSLNITNEFNESLQKNLDIITITVKKQF